MHIPTHDVVHRFLPPLLRMLGSMFTQTNSCYHNTIFIIIAMTNEYCGYNRWYSHFGNVIIVDSIHVDFILQATFLGEWMQQL